MVFNHKMCFLCDKTFPASNSSVLSVCENLTEIPVEMPYIFGLIFCGNNNITEFSVNVKHLIVDSCEKLEKIFLDENTQMLKIISCPNLTEIVLPKESKLFSITVEKSEKLKLPYVKNLEYLKIVDMPPMKIIDYPILDRLTIVGTNITEFPLLKSLWVLKVEDCVLEHLLDFPRLDQLILENVKINQPIPPIKSLRYLCVDTGDFSILPSFPSLKSADFLFCTGVYLPVFPSVYYMYFSNCADVVIPYKEDLEIVRE
jgi:hypothetical protein